MENVCEILLVVDDDACFGCFIFDLVIVLFLYYYYISFYVPSLLFFYHLFKAAIKRQGRRMGQPMQGSLARQGVELDLRWVRGTTDTDTDTDVRWVRGNTDLRQGPSYCGK